MIRFEKLKSEQDLNVMSEIMSFVTANIIKRRTKEEYGKPIEISNFDLEDIKQNYKEWLSYELNESQ